MTASAAKTADTDKKDELKPVAGGYLAELKLSDIGPNAHQPRTIFDEDELNELSASIKEVGVLQPIVVRKRPASQIAAAKAAKHDETESSTNPFAGHLDSPYELIMGERRWPCFSVGWVGDDSRHRQNPLRMMICSAMHCWKTCTVWP